MKKITKALAIVFALGLVFSMASCKDAPVENNQVQEIKLDKPKIEVRAFPGYNYVSWGWVDGADAIYVIRNDGEIAGFSQLSMAALTSGLPVEFHCLDKDVSNGIEYEYTAYAIVTDGDNVIENTLFPAQLTGSDVTQGDGIVFQGYRFRGNQASAKIKAIVPEAGTHALDLITAVDKNDKAYVLDSKKIKVELIDNNQIWVSFPTKGYLKYTVKLYRGNELETFETTWTDADIYNLLSGDAIITENGLSYNQNFYSVNGKFAQKFNVTNAGDYKVTVDVEAIINGSNNGSLGNNGYPKSPTITADTVVNVVQLDNLGARTANKKVFYKDADTIRVLWTPAADFNMNYYEPANYTVYYRDLFTNYWTAISSKEVKTAQLDKDGNEVKDKKTGEVVYDVTSESTVGKEAWKNVEFYYVDFKISENKASNGVAHDFRIVLSKDGVYEGVDYNVAANTLNIAAYVNTAHELSLSETAPGLVIEKVALDEDGIANDFLIGVNAQAIKAFNSEVWNAARPTKIKSVKYTFADVDGLTLGNDAYDKSCTVLDNIGSNTFVVKDVELLKYMYVQVVTEEAGMADAYTFATSVLADAIPATKTADVTGAGALSVQFKDINDDKDVEKQDAYFTFTLANEQQKVKSVKYAVAKDDEVAMALAFSDKAKDATVSILEKVAYGYLGDFNKDEYVAVLVTIEEAGKKDRQLLKVTTAAAAITAGYDSAVNPTASVVYADMDHDGLVNDAVIFVTPKTDTELVEVKYVTAPVDGVSKLLLSTDAAKKLEIPEKVQRTYVWTEKDIAEDARIAVYVKATKGPKYGYVEEIAGTAANEAKAAKEASGELTGTVANKATMTVKYLCLDNDGVTDDVLITLSLAKPDYVTAKAADKDAIAYIRYAINETDADTAAKFLYSADYSKELTVPTSDINDPKRTYYFWTINDIAADNYVAVEAKIDRDDAYYYVAGNSGTSKSASLEAGNADEFYIRGSMFIKDNDDRVNDVRLSVELPPDEYGKHYKLEKILYVEVKADELEDNYFVYASDYENFIYSTNVKTLELKDSTYTYDITNIKAGSRVYFMAEASIEGKANILTTVGSVTSSEPYEVRNSTTNNWYVEGMNVPTSLSFAANTGTTLNDIGDFIITVAKGNTLKIETATDLTAAGAKQLVVRKGTPIAPNTYPSIVASKNVNNEDLESYEFTGKFDNIPADMYFAMKITIEQEGLKPYTTVICTTTAAAAE